MRPGELFEQMKEAVGDDKGNFAFVISAANSHEQLEIIKTAKWLEEELYIRLKKCEVQKAMITEGVFLAGRILNL
ncbi:hypothetical protein [Bacillus sp. MUM 13]|uniref:hypothetical protein n=1 Tax=Bacillus sp. MUM 13 TaxID=1678001 RepID=UPI0008F5949F|nr:hypothetical protein [Bacillus sp. MUM 13]OIK08510.1 hypothetical protein BIV59_19855 [Bacillus sp. MUM 13]